MAEIVRTYNYTMGFAVDGVEIPDPAVFTGKASALDSEGGRDATGKLHRNMVATKYPVKLEYHAISYAMMESIMSKMQGSSFKFTFPDPLNGTMTVKAYVGDRDWEVIMANGAPEGDWKRNWYGNLSFSVIQF